LEAKTPSDVCSTTTPAKSNAETKAEEDSPTGKRSRGNKKLSPGGIPKTAKTNPLSKFLVKLQPGQPVSKADKKMNVEKSKKTEQDDDDIQIIDQDPKLESRREKVADYRDSQVW
jgi:hypothetical protein